MYEDETYDAIIVGGGAAGLAAAVAIAWKSLLLCEGDAKTARGACGGNADAAGASETKRPKTFARHAKIALFEADDRVGRSILATGNGRCNFSNAAVSTDMYRNASFVKEVFAAVEAVAFWPRRSYATGTLATLGATGADGAAANGQRPGATEYAADASTVAAATDAASNAVLDFFADLGLCWREEGQGRLFPITGKASTVLDVLRAAAQRLGVRECCALRVRSVEPPREPGKPYTLHMADGSFQRSRLVICAVGGSAAQEMLPRDLEFSRIDPVLCPLRCDARDIRALDNIRVRCAISLERAGMVVAHERGEVLFRKYGLSGIAVFNLSRFAQSGDVAVIDFFPNISRNELQEYLLERARSVRAFDGNDASCQDIVRGMMLPLVAEALLKVLKLKPDDLASAHTVHRLSQVMKRFKVTVEGMGDPKQSQVHRGGFACSDFAAETMECKRYPGMFAAGEMLDVDAPCGGYNLHWAWASGVLAGAAAAERIAL